MKLAVAVPAVALAAMAWPALAQSSDDAVFVKAAFACAILAAESSDASGNQKLASPLASSAAEKARSGAAALVALLNSKDAPDEGPLGDFLRKASPDFLVGLYFAESQKEIDGLLPKAGETVETYDRFKLRRETEADLEFAHRNCDIVARQ